jgi:hypothetical protein
VSLYIWATTKASVNSNSESGNCSKTLKNPGDRPAFSFIKRLTFCNTRNTRGHDYFITWSRWSIHFKGKGNADNHLATFTYTYILPFDLLLIIFPGTTHLRYSQKIIARSGWTSRWALRSMEFQDALRQDEVHGERALRFGFRECVRLITKWMSLVHTGLLPPAGGHHSLLTRVILYFSFFVETTGGRDSPFSSFPSALHSSGSACAHFWGKHYWMKHFEPWILMMCGTPFYAQSGNSTNAKHSGHI